MAGYETFLEELQSALNHLNDPSFQPAPGLCQRLGIAAGLPDWSEPLRQAIHRLKPSLAAPSNARSRRLYQVLLQRYIHHITQEQTAEQLHITARHLRREQNEAVEVLARLLWQKSAPNTAAPPAVDPPADDWSAQLRQELTALQRGAPAGTVEVSATIQGVVELLAPVVAKTGVSLKMGALPAGLAVAVQASGLRQLLVRAITEWSRSLTDGEISIQAERAGKEARIQLAGSRAPIEHLDADPLLQELLNQFDGHIRIESTPARSLLTIDLPATPPVRVLVVDDNEDLLHFYQRYVANTRYQIIPLTDGELVIETLEETRPDAIVLDVMLPTVDGWELLTRLRQHPLGRALPILVCSVIQEEELARALGASGYIRKPVGRSSLIQALDAATRQAGSGSAE